MLTITIISTLTFYYQLSHAIIGPNGQECVIGSSNACPYDEINNQFTSLIDSEIECEDPYECCLCKSITCGNTFERCDKFKAEATFSAFYVSPITINGDLSDGATIECSGNNACDGAQINGEYIKEFKCDEDRACANGQFSLSYINDEGKVECDGNYACYGSTITVYNVETICCDGAYSCSDSLITVINPKKDFELQCKERGACQGATVIIKFTSSSTRNEIKGFKCDKDYSCNNLNLQIINESPLNIKIEDLDCDGNFGCQNAVFTIIETSGHIIFEDCECEGNSCIGATQTIPGTPIAGGKCFPFGSTSTTTNKILPIPPTAIIQQYEQNNAIIPSTLHSNFIIGPNGQDCTPDSDNNLATACPIINTGTTIEYTSLIGTEIECEKHFDCCTCKSIICETCEKFEANGDSSSFYVYPIIINGELDEGTEIDCAGDRSCFGAQFNGTNIGEIKCSGDISCSNSKWNIICIINDDDGCKIECEGDMSCQNSLFKVSNSGGLKCGDYACINSKFKLNTNIGEKIECDSEYSCQNTYIEINQIETLKCGDNYACQGATIIITDPKDELEIECDGAYACENLNLKIIIPSYSTISEIEKIKCSSEFACLNANITIINNRISNEYPLIIEELNCDSFGSCNNLKFNLIGNILFQECKCGDKSGCLDIIGIDSCFINLDKIECKDQACIGQNITIRNPSEDFELSCQDIASCNDLTLTIIINNNAKDYPIDEIKGVKCEKEISCLGLKYNIINQQIGVVLNVEKIECKKENSCQNAIFNGNGIGNVIFEEIKCEETNSCKQCLAESQQTLIYCDSPIFDN